jgi:hypothetical protein
MFVNHTKKYIFVHVPKCGGTTVQETLLKHSIFANEDFTMYEFHSSLLCEAAQQYIDQGYKAIIFVRDPYTRFVSAYQQIIYMTNVYPDVFALVSELKKKNYLLPLAPMYFFTGSAKGHTVFKMEDFRNNMIKVLDMFGYPRVWWNRNQTDNKGGRVDPNAFYEETGLRNFVTEFYFKDFVDFRYPMKVAVTPFPHVVPYFETKFKYDWKDVRDKPNDIYFWAMKSVYDQEQDPPDSRIIIFQGASGPDPPQ